MADFIWILKNNITNEEHVLEYIVERKKMDDLASSIFDGRYDEQRYRLKESHMKAIYLVEGFLSSNAAPNISQKSLDVAMMNTALVYNFIVARTDSPSESARYLARATNEFIGRK